MHTSEPAPAKIRSPPPPPKMQSLPDPPNIKSVPDVPRTRYELLSPQMVSGQTTISVKFRLAHSGGFRSSP